MVLTCQGLDTFSQKNLQQFMTLDWSLAAEPSIRWYGGVLKCTAYFGLPSLLPNLMTNLLPNLMTNLLPNLFPAAVQSLRIQGIGGWIMSIK
jgi:hypothetical protein